MSYTIPPIILGVHSMRKNEIKLWTQVHWHFILFSSPIIFCSMRKKSSLAFRIKIFTDLAITEIDLRAPFYKRKGIQGRTKARN